MLNCLTAYDNNSNNNNDDDNNDLSYKASMWRWRTVAIMLANSE